MNNDKAVIDPRVMTAPVAVDELRKPGAMQSRISVISGVIGTKKKLITSLTPGERDVDRFIRSAVLTISMNDQLAACSIASIMRGIYMSATLGLEVGGSLQEAYLLPFKGQAVFVPGYRGLVQLAYRNPRLEMLNAFVVYEQDEYDVDLGSTMKVTHKPNPPKVDKPAMVAAYMVAFLRGSSRPVIFPMWSQEIEHIRDKFSKAAKIETGGWFIAPEEMARKTVIRRGIKLLPLTAELAMAIRPEDNLEADQNAYSDIEFGDLAVDAEFTEEPKTKPDPVASAAQRRLGKESKAEPPGTAAGPAPSQGPTPVQETKPPLTATGPVAFPPNVSTPSAAPPSTEPKPTADPPAEKETPPPAEVAPAPASPPPTTGNAASDVPTDPAEIKKRVTAIQKQLETSFAGSALPRINYLKDVTGGEVRGYLPLQHNPRWIPVIEKALGIERKEE